MARLALVAGCAATGAVAQTANPVTLYGRVFAMFESVEARGDAGGASPPIARRNRVTNQASRLGVRGLEDIGGDLRVFFQLEANFPPDSATNTFASRSSAIGVQGSWGRVLFGRWDSPMKVAASRPDAFFDVTLGGYTAAMGGSGIEKIQGSFSRTDQNVVQYWSPGVSGIEVRLAHAVNEARTPLANPSRSGASITYTEGVLYAEGGLYAGIAYDRLVDMPFVGATALDKQSGSAVFGMYAAGPLRFGALYQEFRRDGFSTQNAWLGGVTGTLGKHRFIYQHQRARGGTNLNVQGSRSSPAPEPRALLFPPPGTPGCHVNAVGYRYVFSTRTRFEALYALIDNNASATCNFGANTLPIDFGQDPRGFALGLRQNF